MRQLTMRSTSRWLATSHPHGNVSGQKSGTPFCGRGGFMRGRGRFNAVQASGSSYHTIVQGGVNPLLHSTAIYIHPASLEPNQCKRCKGMDTGRINAHPIQTECSWRMQLLYSRKIWTWKTWRTNYAAWSRKRKCESIS